MARPAPLLPRSPRPRAGGAGNRGSGAGTGPPGAA
ncbi:hypothetical protein GA0115251_11081, partial [Streptomyces sp. TverLS-915]